MRVTFSSTFREGAAEINLASQRLADAQRQVASGRRIGLPSDDPAGATAAVTDHATIGTLDTYTRTTDAATSRLTVVDSVLSDIVDKISAAQTTALGSRGTTQTQGQRDAAAANLQGISDALLADLTTQFRGAYLFSGAKATVAPFTQAGKAVFEVEYSLTPAQFCDKAVALKFNALKKGLDLDAAVTACPSPIQ